MRACARADTASDGDDDKEMLARTFFSFNNRKIETHAHNARE